MSFRGHDPSAVPEPTVDPLTRFLALHRELDAGRSVLDDREPLRQSIVVARQAAFVAATAAGV